MNRTENDLNRTLETQAEQFARRGGAMLDIERVLDRAGEIKRGRRMRATMVMAACVLALAVPTAIVVSDTAHHHAKPTPAKQVRTDHSALTLGDLKTGALPRTGYGVEHRWHTSGTVVDLAGGSGEIGEVREVTPTEGGFMVAGQDTESGEKTAYFVDEEGKAIAQTWPMEGDFAVSDSGTMVAFVQPDGTPVVVQSDGSVHQLPRVPADFGLDVANVAGEDCHRRGQEAPDGPQYGIPEGTCIVTVNVSSETPEVWTSSIEGTASSASKWTKIKLMADVAPDGKTAGITQFRDDLSTCSAVDDVTLTQLWSTCDHRFVAFSPDGKLLLATGSIGDGMDTQLAVLDAATGKVELDLTTQGAGITQMAWEDDSHVLATVFEKGRWAILRVGLDGSREYAVPPVKGTDDLTSPFVLPSS